MRLIGAEKKKIHVPEKIQLEFHLTARLQENTTTYKSLTCTMKLSKVSYLIRAYLKTNEIYIYIQGAESLVFSKWLENTLKTYNMYIPTLKSCVSEKFFD